VGFFLRLSAGKNHGLKSAWGNLNYGGTQFQIRLSRKMGDKQLIQQTAAMWFRQEESSVKGAA
jgi:hypothetical protein